MKKEIFQKIIGISIIMVIVCANITLAASKTDLTNKQEDINDKIDQAKENLEGVKENKSEKLQELEKLTGQIAEYENEISELDSQIKELNSSIADAEEKIRMATEEFNEKQELLDKSLVSIYETGGISYLDVLLNSQDITEFISNYYMVEELTSYNTELLQKIDKQKKEIEAAKAGLEENKQKVETAKKNEQIKQNQLKNAKQEKNKQVKELSEEEKKIQEEIDQFEKDKKQIQAELKRIAEEEKKNNTSDITNNPSASGYIKPVVGYSITTGMYYSSGKYHGAVDYSGAGIAGKPVLAVKDGTVVTSVALKNSDGSYRSYGEYIVINHHDGTMTLYAHGMPGSRKVSAGQKVKQGQTIMNVGTTGNSTGYHLHFEVLVNGVRVNPKLYLP